MGGDNGIYGIDPTDGSVVQMITGSPWADTSQRGLAYDPAADVFYIGGWNEGIVYRVAGPSHADAGRDALAVQPGRPEHLRSRLERLLRAALGGNQLRHRHDLADRPDDLRGDRGDPASGRWRLRRRRHRARRRRQPLDRRPELAATPISSRCGLPTFSDVPWLSVAPTEGTIAPDGTADLDISVDTTGLAPDVYRALVASRPTIPITRSSRCP